MYKIIIPLIMLVAAASVAAMIVFNPPASGDQARARDTRMNVEVEVITPQPYQVYVESYGVVEPRTQSVLTSQVSGQIITMSDSFREGGFFNKGDTLLKIDPRDYQANVDISQASLAAAKLALEQEKARGQQAYEDWQRLRKDEKADDLALRIPQLANAKATVKAAQAELDKALLALQRTNIKAPYAGRVLTKQVDLGQVISSNTVLGEVYATDVVEVRLPINNDDLGLLRLPEEFREGMSDTPAIDVTFTSDVYEGQQWQGEVVRTEGAIDKNSQQLYVVAQINDPFSNTHDQQSPVKIGQFVNATIAGKLLNNAIVIDNRAIYQGTYVYTVVNEELRRTEVDIRWQNDDVTLIQQGLTEQAMLVKTPLGRVSSGTRVSVVNSSQERAADAARRRQGDNS